MICPSCRQEAPESRAFCPYCGAALPTSSGPSEESPTPPWMPPTEVPGPGGPPEPTEPPGDTTGEPEKPIEHTDLPPAEEDEEPLSLEDEEPPSFDGDDAELPSLDEEDDEGPDDRSLEVALGGTGTPRAGLVRGLLQGSLVFLVMALLAAVAALAGLLTADTGLGEIARVAGLVFLGFHHVGIRAEFPTFRPEGLPGLPGGEEVTELPVGSFDISFTVAVALMLGTLVALFLLYRAGRRAAEQGGGSLAWRAVQGASVAIPYAILSVGVAAVVSFSLRLPSRAAALVGPEGTLDLAPTLLSAALWPLGLAALAGSLGGLLSGAPDAASRGRRALAIVAGGGRMAAALLVAGFLGLLVLAALSPDLTAAYMEEATSGRSGLQLLLATLLVLPNLVLWGLAIGMGGAIGYGEYVSGTIHIASLFRFPSDVDPAALVGGAALGGAPDPTGTFAIAPIGYFVFIPLAIIALAVAARRTAQRAEVGTAGEGATVGAISGVAFALWFVVGILLAGIGLRASIAFGEEARVQLLRLGPVLATGALVGLAWGVVVGALGGAMGAAGEPWPSGRRRRREEIEVEEEEAPEEPVEEERTLDLVPGPEPASVSAPPPMVEVGTGPTGFEGLAAQRQAILQGGALPGEPAPTPWTDPEAEEAPAGEEPAGPQEPPPELQQVPPQPQPEPPTRPQPEPEPAPKPEAGEDEDFPMPDPDRDVPDWLPEALRPEADEIDEDDLEARWTEGPDEEGEGPRHA